MAAPGPSPGSGKSSKNTFQSLKATVSVLTEQNSSRFWRSVSHPAENPRLRGFEAKNYRERNCFQIRSLGNPDCLAPPTSLPPPSPTCLSSSFPEGKGRRGFCFQGTVFTPSVLLSPPSPSETLIFTRGFPMGPWEGHTALLIQKKRPAKEGHREARRGSRGCPALHSPWPLSALKTTDALQARSPPIREIMLLTRDAGLRACQRRGHPGTGARTSHPSVSHAHLSP